MRRPCPFSKQSALGNRALMRPSTVMAAYAPRPADNVAPSAPSSDAALMALARALGRQAARAMLAQRAEHAAAVASIGLGAGQGPRVDA